MSSAYEKLPAPRLQLRWRPPTKKELKRRTAFITGDTPWTCVYELIIPLQNGDIRARNRRLEQSLEISRTFTSTDRPDDKMNYTPFRDGAHAQWDSEALNGLPIFVIEPDGTAHRVPRR